MSIITKTAIRQLDALQRREVSAVDLLEETIARSEKFGPVLNPFALKLYERARQLAREADKQLGSGDGGPLCGLPVTIKDSQFLAGYPCTNGYKALSRFIPNETCKAVDLLEQAGAVIFAKTTCPEFSLTGVTHSDLFGTTSNPWDLNRTSGGSSGGAGAAVASGLGALSLGGDGGGSIRIPAAFCGIVGFKPSFGQIPREPCFPSWYSLVSYGPMTRSVADASLMYRVLTSDASASDRLRPENLNDFPLIVSEDLGFAPVNADVRIAFRAVLEQLSAAGARVIDDNPGLPSSVITWAITATFDAYQHANDETYNHVDIGEVAQGFIDFGAQFTQQQFDEAQAYRENIRLAYDDLFKRNDAAILITPTLGCEAFPHGSIHPHEIDNTPIEMPWLDWAGFLYDANLAGLPACSIPMGLGDNGLPLGLQILGAAGNDDQVLRVAAAIEALIGWSKTIIEPPLSDQSVQQQA